MSTTRIRRFFSGLRGRMLLLVLAAMLPALGLIFHTALEQRNDAITEVQTHVREIAVLTASEESALIAGFRQLLMVLVRQPTFRTGSPDEFRRIGGELIRDDPRVHNIARIDLSGNIVASVLPFTPPVSVADRPYFRHALATGGFSVGDYQIGRISGKSTINFSYPVRDVRGKIVSVIYTALDLDWLNRGQAEKTGHVPPGATLSRIDRNGVVFAQYPETHGWRGAKFPVPEVLRSLQQHRSEAIEARGPDGIPRLYVFSPIERPAGSGTAYVLLGVPRDLLFEKGNHLLRVHLAGLAFVTLLGMLSAWFGADTAFLHPLRSLLDATRRFGAGDLAARSGLPPSEGEVGLLAAAFDRMAESIESRESARRRDEARLATATAQLRAIYDASPDMIFVHAEDGNVIDANDRVVETLGCTSDRFIGQMMPDFMGGGYLVDGAMDLIRETLAGGTPEFEWASRRADGSDFPTEVRLRRFERVGDDGVSQPCVLASIRDISERKRQEAARREAEQLYRTLVETLPDAVTVTGIEGDIEYASPRALEIYGAKSPSDAIGTSFLRWIDPADHAKAIANLRNVMAGAASPNDNEYRLLRFDGTHIVGAINARPLRDAEGRVKGMIATTRDTTDRKRQEEALHRSNALFQALIDASPLAIATLSPEGEIRSWNPAAERISGWLAKDAIGRKLPINPETDDPQSLAIMRRILSEEKVTGMELPRPRADGTLSVVNFSSALLRDSAGAVEGVLLLGEDITARKEAEAQRETLEAQLRQSQKMEAVGQLAGGIAHDFNNLMTVILGQVDRIRKRWHEPDLLDWIDDIGKAGERAAMLTRQLLAFSRRQLLQPKVVDLNGVLDDMRSILGRLIGENYPLDLRTDPALWPVLADPTQIGQVVVNLVVNARDALPDGGEIRITTKNIPANGHGRAGGTALPAGDCVLLSVHDGGMGMNPATKARLFEPFFTTKEIGKGTGLGLSTVYGIILQSGGTIEIESAPGAGTTVDIYLPRSKDQAAASTRDDAVREPPRGHATLLLVEDADHVRGMVRELLEEYGYAVLEARHGAEALVVAAAQDGPIDLLLTDMVMPELGGRQLAEALRAARPGIRVLFMSGYAEDARLRSNESARDFFFLQKPFSPETLGWKIHEVLSAPRSR